MADEPMSIVTDEKKIGPESKEQGELDLNILQLKCKWSKQTFDLDLSDDTSYGELQEEIYQLTHVRPSNQKLMNLKYVDPESGEKISSSSKFDEDALLKDFVFRKGGKFILIGTADADAEFFASQMPDDSVVDDMDWEYVPDIHETKMARSEENQKKFKKYLKKLKVNIMNEPRPGKKLCVLDLDYTLFDMKSKADNFEQLKRPFTDDFLEAIYQHYDLVIWSQTSWRWLEIKLTELGILMNPRYKISFVLDKSCMFSVTSKIRGRDKKHQVKCLPLIWAKFDQWDESNTIHIDDLGRNFAMNPQSGLKIKAYKRAHENRATDNELLFLARYLILLALTVDDFSTLDHGEWQHYLADHAGLLPP